MILNISRMQHSELSALLRADLQELKFGDRSLEPLFYAVLERAIDQARKTTGFQSSRPIPRSARLIL
jgi:hypothetical protein